MKRKSKTLTLLGLGSIVVVGLLYWRLAPPKVHAKDDRPKVEIFAEALGKGDFKRCYRLMTAEYRARVTRSEFVDQWHQQIGKELGWLGEFNEVSCHQPGIDKETDLVERERLVKRQQRSNQYARDQLSDFVCTIYFANGRLRLRFATKDGDVDSPVEWLSRRGGAFSRPAFSPTPTPPAPIS